MSFDRSKFKASKIKDVQQAEEDLKERLGQEDNGRISYIKYKPGKNTFRIYPSHPEELGGDGLFSQPKVTVFLPLSVPERDDEGKFLKDPKGNVLMKMGQKQVFNSKIHGGTEKDLVEEYRDMALRFIEEDMKICQDEEQKLKLAKKKKCIVGDFATKVNGIKYQSKNVMFVDSYEGSKKTFGLLEYGKGVKDSMNAIAASVDSADSVISLDPFTDPDDGRAIIITYDPNATQASDYYKTVLDSTLVPTEISGTMYDLPRKFPLTDADLENFAKVDSLAKRFVNVFTIKDFKMQLEGLENFDSKHNIGMFEEEEFLEVIEEISAYYPEEEEVVEEEGDLDIGFDPSVEESPFDFMEKKELKEYLNDREVSYPRTSSEEDLRVIAKSIDKAEQIDQQAEEEEESAKEEAFENEDSYEAPVEKKKEKAPIEKEEKTSEEAPALTRAERLAKLRNK